MSYDNSKNILVQESIGNLFRDELSWNVRFTLNVCTQAKYAHVAGQMAKISQFRQSPEMKKTETLLLNK